MVEVALSLLPFKEVSILTWEELYEDFKNRLMSNKTDNTIKSYLSSIESFGFRDKPDLESIITATNRFKEAGLTNKTIVDKYSALRYMLKNYFFEFDGTEILRMKDYMSELKVDSREVPVATPEQVKVLLEAGDTRESAIIALLYYTGLRVGEVAMLNIGDIKCDEEGNWLVVPNDPKTRRTTKGKEGRTLYIHPTLWAYLSKYLDYRASYLMKFLIKDPEALILGVREKNGTGQRMHVNSLSRIVKRLCVDVGYTDLSCHSFRHCIATELNQKGVSLVAIKELLGHKDLSTTQKYIKASRYDVKNALESIEE